MFESICILGRQKGLSLAELESLFGADNIKQVNEHAALLDKPSANVPFERLGGTLKLARTLIELSNIDWKSLEKYLIENVPKHLEYIPEGKVKFGISTYGLSVSPKAINAAGLSIKKAVRQAGRSMRVIPNDANELNAAQVLRNKLTDKLGMELLLIKNGDKTVLAQTVRVQDIDAYAARDQARPARDARVGMLPPKLAQIIINLANPPINGAVLDPFCGTGVILQEALLMGYQVIGSDIETRMTHYTAKNLDWLIQQSRYNVHKENYRELSVNDATEIVISDLTQNASTKICIAAETYLGRPFSTEPNPDKLREVIQDVDTIHKKFLQNVARQTKPSFRMCIAAPAWHTKNGVKHLPVLDRLTDMGYTRMSFVHASNDELIYHREGQIVGRELVTLIRK